MGLGQGALAQTKWDLPVQWPPTNFYTKMIDAYAERVKEETGGAVEITVHSGGALGFKGPEMLAIVRDGVVAIGDVTPALVSGEEPFLGIDRIPFIFENYEAFASFMAYARPAYDRIYARHNQLMLFLVPWPPTKSHTKKTLGSLDDFQGLKIRTHDKLGTEFHVGIGASPIQLPWAEVVPSLASGAIEGVNTSASSAVDGKFWEFLSDTMLFDLQWAVSGVNVNLDALKGLSEEHQATILRVAREMEPEFWLGSKREDALRLKTLADNGINISPLPDDVRAKAVEVAAKQADEFAGKIPEARDVLAKWREYRAE
jgi:TRAP-type C4-dicarboxylate transport system substrate-binding protein